MQRNESNSTHRIGRKIVPRRCRCASIAICVAGDRNARFRAGFGRRARADYSDTGACRSASLQNEIGGSGTGHCAGAWQTAQFRQRYARASAQLNTPGSDRRRSVSAVVISRPVVRHRSIIRSGRRCVRIDRRWRDRVNRRRIGVIIRGRRCVVLGRG